MVHQQMIHMTRLHTTQLPLRLGVFNCLDGNKLLKAKLSWSLFPGAIANIEYAKACV